MAKVLLPEDAPSDVAMWANLFTDSTRSGWTGSPTQTLTPGQWTTLVWDMRDVDWKAGDVLVGIQIGAEGGDYQGKIYVDDVELFTN